MLWPFLEESLNTHVQVITRHKIVNKTDVFKVDKHVSAFALEDAILNIFL
jgi:hypothetical protein